MKMVNGLLLSKSIGGCLNLTTRLNSKGLLSSYCLRKFSTSCILKKLIPVKTPNFPESITEGDVKWSKSIGATVKVDEIVGEIETDKTSIPIISPCDGILKELHFSDGSKVNKGDIVCSIDECEVKDKSTPKESPVVESPKVEKPKIDTPKPQVQKTIPSNETTSVIGKDSTVSSTDNIERIETRVAMTRMRQTIAHRLKESQNVNAMLTTFNEIDMSKAYELRNKYKDQFLKKYNVKLGFMSLFLKASIYSLEKQPIVNAVISNNEILYRNFIDISIAVSSPKGLVVPVIRNAQKMTILDLEKSVSLLAEKGRNGQLTIEDMEGGTFTITNGGVFGSMLSTPIINMPQATILGMHAIKERPVAIDGRVEIRPIMYVALTYDHRLIDGREAVLFLKSIKDVVEDPSTIIMGL